MGDFQFEQGIFCLIIFRLLGDLSVGIHVCEDLFVRILSVFG